VDFNLSDEQKMLVSGAERYVRERCSVEARRQASATADGFSRQHLAQFAEMGWLALPLPEDAGGYGAEISDLALLMEQLGHGVIAEPIVDTAVLCATLLAHSSNAEVRANILERVAAGECLLALAHVEGNGRSEFETEVNCRATKTAQGWTLQGEKHLVFFGNSANYWLVSARIDDSAGFGIFLVDAHSAGATVNAYPLIDGTRAADIRFANVALPASALLLSGADATAALEDAVNRSILALSAAAVGSMEAVMKMTADYLKTRVQYGQPLANFQSLQHRMAEMLVESEQARSMLYRAIAAMEENDRDYRRRAIAGAKALISKSGLFVTGQGIQLHGGIGATDELATSHHYKVMVAYSKRFGDVAFNLQRAAQH